MCKNPKCSVSTFIDEETLTFGWGHLDDLGVWEHGCMECALAWKEKHPEDSVMWDDSVFVEDEKIRDASFDSQWDNDEGWAKRQVNPHIYDDVDSEEDY